MQYVVDGLINGTHAVLFGGRIIHPDMWTQVFRYETERLWHGKVRKMKLIIKDHDSFREPCTERRESYWCPLNRPGLRKAASNPVLSMHFKRSRPDYFCNRITNIEPRSLAKVPRHTAIDRAGLELCDFPQIVQLSLTSGPESSSRRSTEDLNQSFSCSPSANLIRSRNHSPTFRPSTIREGTKIQASRLALTPTQQSYSVPTIKSSLLTVGAERFVPELLERSYSGRFREPTDLRKSFLTTYVGAGTASLKNQCSNTRNG